MLVYIAGPYSAAKRIDVNRNIRRAMDLALDMHNKFQCATPVVPHTMFQWAEGIHYERIMEMCFEILAKCDYIWMMPGWINSPGAVRELEFATKMGISRLDNSSDE